MLRATWRGLETWHSRTVRPNRRASPRPYREEAARDRSSKGGTALVAYFHRRDGAERQRVMTLAPHEFIRRFLLHVLPRGSSPHPPLRLARQFSTQSQYCACPQVAWRRAAAGAGRIARATRSSPALSLLRRAHVHHRDLRAMEAIPRATSRICTNRERRLVTPHGLRSSHAATPPLRRMRQHTLFAKISATGLNMSRRRFPIHGPPGEQISLIKSPPTPAPSRFRHHHNQAKLANPHRPSPQPRGFVLGRFSYAGPMPRRVACDGRHPKTFTMTVA